MFPSISAGSGFKVFAGLLEQEGNEVRAIPAPGGGSRAFCDRMNAYAQGEGLPGMGYIFWREKSDWRRWKLATSTSASGCAIKVRRVDRRSYGGSGRFLGAGPIAKALGRSGRKLSEAVRIG